MTNSITQNLIVLNQVEREEDLPKVMILDLLVDNVHQLFISGKNCVCILGLVLIKMKSTVKIM